MLAVDPAQSARDEVYAMNKSRPIGLMISVATIGLLSTVGLTYGADRGRPLSDIDIVAMVAETQKQSPDPDVMDLVWWLPLEFWQASMAQEGSLTEKDLQDVAEVLSPYTMVSVAFGALGPFGGVTWLDPELLRQKTVLVDADGNEYRPYPSAEVGPDARNLISMMQPMLGSLLGAMGENFNFFFFPADGVSGKPIADPSRKGSFSVKVGDKTYEWRLPLGSVLPPQKCPVDDEPMPGNWQYCPWHGKKLVVVPK